MQQPQTRITPKQARYLTGALVIKAPFGQGLGRWLRASRAAPGAAQARLAVSRV
jgi:hypothetical protein